MEVSGQLQVPAAFLLVKKNLVPAAYEIKWVTAGLNAVAKKKISSPVGNLTPVVQPAAQSL
jgi:hypothetical protein